MSKSKVKKPEIYWLEGLLTHFEAKFPHDTNDLVRWALSSAGKSSAFTSSNYFSSMPWTMPAHRTATTTICTSCSGASLVRVGVLWSENTQSF